METLPRVCPRVLIVGYSPAIRGGVTQVTATLLEHLDHVKLHPILHMYRPAYLSVVRTLRSMLKLPWVVLNDRAEILHVIVGSRGDVVRTIPVVLLGRLMGRKVILQFHKSVPAILPSSQTFIGRLARLAWRQVTALFFLSSSLSQEVDSVLPSAIRKYVIPNALGGGWMGIPTIPFEDRDHDVMFLGRWSEEKGTSDLLQIFSYRQGYDAQQHVPVCHVYSDDRPIENTANIRFHDWLPKQGVQSVLRRTRILILPSYIEAYPTVLLEAAACGTPFVSTTIAGIPDIAKESEAGLVCPPGDIDGLRSAVQTLMCNRELWIQLSKNGWSWAQQQEPVRISRLWASAYRELVEQAD